jgi:adenosine kinase
MKIVCTGSVAYDYLMKFPGYFKDHLLPDQLESVSLSFLVDQMVKQRGGVAPNIAYTLALLGERPLLFATVGEDFEDYRQWLESKGIDTRYARVIPGKFTASFFVNTDLSNAQIASFYTGAMADAASMSIAELKDEKPDLVVVSPNAPDAMLQYVTECRQLGIPYLYDPSQQLARLGGEELCEGVAGAYSLFVNDYEFGLLKKHTCLSDKAIENQVKILVITRGKNGADIYTEEKNYHIPVVPETRITDPTGVGDAFRGGFLSGWRMGLDWQTCGQMGSLAATYCLENVGTQSHSFTPAEFVKRYREYFDDQGALDVFLK